MRTLCQWVGVCVVVAAAFLGVLLSGHSSLIVISEAACFPFVGCDSVDVTADESAIGIEAHGQVSNAQGTDIEATARATANAILDTNAENASATATHTATATGIGAVLPAASRVPDRIRNDGNLAVTAIAGEDESGTSQQIVSLRTDMSVGSARADATGTSTVDAAGIRVGSNGAEITNTGSVDVLGRARARVYGEADSGDGTATASSISLGSATAVGISAVGGDNRVRNDGAIRVDAVVRDAFTRAYTWSGSSDSTSYAETQATATGTGISTGVGTDDVRNAGRLTVIADADAVAEAWADAPVSANEYETANVTAISRAVGIDAGAGSNVIRNDGTVNVRAMASARASTFGGIGGFSIAFGATATGIKVGDGGSDIQNAGTIDVLASASAHGASNASAVGILGGNGDDTIVNAGTIFTGVVDSPEVLRTLVIADQSGTTITTGIRRGVAVATGAGNDAVTLAVGSQTVGDIDLGSGDDTLILVGNAAVTGLIQAGSGTDTLVLNGAGGIAFTPLAFEAAVKQGPGTYTVPTLSTLQRLAVEQGILRLNSGYQFAPTGTFQATVYNDGSHGQLSVAGTATLDGGLHILRGPGLYRNGTKYDVVTADAMTGWFTSTTLPAPTALVSFRVNPPRDHVEIEAVVQSFSTTSTNPTHYRIAQHLDTLLPGATGDLAGVLGEVQALPAGGFDRAFTSLSPAAYDSLTRATVGSTGQYTQSLQRRLEAVRAYSRTAEEGLATPVLLAAAEADTTLVPILGSYRLSQIQAKHGLWLAGFGQWADQEATPGFTGFTASTGGLTLGYDHTFRDQVTAGLSVGYADTDVDLAENQGGGRIQGVITSLYGSYFTPTLYLDGALSYGHNWYENDRHLRIGTLERTATSEHQGDAFAAYLGAGYAYPLGAWALGPVGALRYVYLAEDAFQETGADSLNLTVGSRGTHSLVSELGVRVAGTVKTAAGTLVPDLSLLWSYDFDLDDRLLTTTYAGAPGAAFSIPGQPVARHGLLLRPGLTFLHPSGVSTALRYTGEFRDGYQAHGVLGEVRVQF